MTKSARHLFVIWCELNWFKKYKARNTATQRIITASSEINLQSKNYIVHKGGFVHVLGRGNNQITLTVHLFSV